jgi:hypothetical protein
MSEKPKTGKELLAHLKETGTGKDRQQQVEIYLLDNAEASAAEVFEWALGQNMPAGTLDKIHRFAKGYAYDPIRPGESANEKLLDALKRVAALETDIRDRDAQNSLLVKENARIRNENEVLRKQQAPEKLRRESKQLQPQ